MSRSGIVGSRPLYNIFELATFESFKSALFHVDFLLRYQPGGKDSKDIPDFILVLV